MSTGTTLPSKTLSTKTAPALTDSLLVEGTTATVAVGRRSVQTVVKPNVWYCTVASFRTNTSVISNLGVRLVLVATNGVSIVEGHIFQGTTTLLDRHLLREH